MGWGFVPSAIVAVAVAITASAARAEPTGQWPAASVGSAEPIVPVPTGRTWDPKRVALGGQLFRDVRLSLEQSRSCATCHPLERGGMDGRTRPFTADGHLNARNTPTIFNVGLSSFYNWDGVADTLEAHAETVLQNPNLMNISWSEILARLGADDGYVSAFRAAYPDGLIRRNVLDALASFERSLETPDSRFDRYLRGARDALTDPERRGYALFKSYGCATCHQGVNIGGNMFQKFGVFSEESAQPPSPDLGRFHVTRRARDRGVFRVPSLRNVAVTAPYFHDGRAASLESAVDTMARVQLGRSLRPEETALIVQFLRTLTGQYRGRVLGPVPAVER